MTFRQFVRRGWVAGLAGALLLASAAGADARARSSVWVMKGAKNTVYLAGSVHALPRDHAELPAQLERAYAASRRVVMEVDLDDMDPLEAVQFVTSRGTLPEGQTLEQVVGPDDWTKVAKLAGSLEVPEAVITRLEPWAAAMVLTQFALMKTGYDPQLGIDMQLAERARADSKPVDGLETVVDQLGIFDARSLDEQKKFLVESADDAPQLADDLRRLIAAWRTGDLKSLEFELNKERTTAPGLYDELLGARNRRWIPQIEALLSQDQDVLVVVGALHFVGHDGLLELLTKAGHKPVPLRQ
ncbi:MAG TPA: TraB/GumN family protein [Steroidobacteraceae bacterium]|nr:TraB/GumN family protein [Steroidobacteraceae bacterium]